MPRHDSPVERLVFRPAFGSLFHGFRHGGNLTIAKDSMI